MNIESIEKISYPNAELKENMEFDCSTSYGRFNFHFKWFNGRWNVWVTLPDGTKREAGVYPNVVNWTGSPDYGLVFSTALQTIDFESLFMTELYLLKWL